MKYTLEDSARCIDAYCEASSYEKAAKLFGVTIKAGFSSANFVYADRAPETVVLRRAQPEPETENNTRDLIGFWMRADAQKLATFAS